MCPPICHPTINALSRYPQRVGRATGRSRALSTGLDELMKGSRLSEFRERKKQACAAGPQSTNGRNSGTRTLDDLIERSRNQIQSARALRRRKNLDPKSNTPCTKDSLSGRLSFPRTH